MMPGHITKIEPEMKQVAGNEWGEEYRYEPDENHLTVHVIEDGKITKYKVMYLREPNAWQVYNERGSADRAFSTKEEALDYIGGV